MLAVKEKRMWEKCVRSVEVICKRISVSDKFESYLYDISPLDTCTFYHEFYVNMHNRYIYLANTETVVFSFRSGLTNMLFITRIYKL